MIIESLSIPRYDAPPLLKQFLPYGHQVTAKKVFDEKEEFFFFITAPTGSGKTDSWVIPALTGDKLGVVFALYPTNALAEDQFNTICALRDEIAPDRQVEFINKKKLEEYRKGYSHHATKGDVFTDLISKMRGRGGIIVTNPDMFILALKNEFRDPYLAGLLRNTINTVIFDEFHLYDLKQSDFILFLLDEFYTSDRYSAKKFVFLSATPSNDMIHKIREIIKAEVIVADEFCDLQEIDKRMILPRVEMKICPGRKFSCGEYIINNFQEFCPFFEGCRSAIILDSAIEVAALSEFLRKNTEYQICEQSGFRKDPMDFPFDILVGNKAVEVGIDFKGNYAIQSLIFSAFSASEFLQRFGRLRNPDPDISYEAICFLPQSVSSYFSGFEKISRDDLKEGLLKTMQDFRVYKSFRWRWGFLEAWEYLCRRAFGTSATKELDRRVDVKKTPQTGGMSTSMRELYLRKRFEKLYHHYFAGTHINPDEIKRFFQRLERFDKHILYYMRELSPFRRRNFSLTIFYEPMSELKSYDLFFLLRWADLEIMERSDFIRKVPGPLKDEIKNYDHDVFGYAWVHGIRDRPRSVSLTGAKIDQICIPEDARIPCLEYGILPVTSSEDGVSICNISLIEKEFRKRGVMCRYLDLPAYQSRKCYELGDYARIVQYKDGSLAIGLDAFIADCAIAESRNHSDSLPPYSKYFL